MYPSLHLSVCAKYYFELMLTIVELLSLESFNIRWKLRASLELGVKCRLVYSVIIMSNSGLNSSFESFSRAVLAPQKLVERHKLCLLSVHIFWDGGCCIQLPIKGNRVLYPKLPTYTNSTNTRFDHLSQLSKSFISCSNIIYQYNTF